MMSLTVLDVLKDVTRDGVSAGGRETECCNNVMLLLRTVKKTI